MTHSRSEVYRVAAEMRTLMLGLLASADAGEGATLEVEEVAYLAPILRDALPRGYVTAVAETCEAAGACDQKWNVRFRAALADRGLTLSTLSTASAAYPRGAAYSAPTPFGSDDGWPTASFIVWAEDASVEA